MDTFSVTSDLFILILYPGAGSYGRHQ